MAGLPNAKKPAIFLKKQMPNSQLIAVAALYKHLATNDSQPEIVASADNQMTATLKKLVENLKVQSNLSPKKFVLSIKKSDSDIKNVQWQQDTDSLNIFIDLNSGNLSPQNLNFKTSGADYDVALLPGVQNLSQLGEIAEKNKQFFKETKLFSIGSDLNAGDEYSHSSSNRPNLTTLAEQVFSSIEGQTIKPEVAQLLFAGILAETRNLSTQIKSNEVFLNLKKLADRGAQTTAVKAIVDKISASEANGRGE
jgi:hypothetical protein